LFKLALLILASAYFYYKINSGSLKVGEHKHLAPIACIAIIRSTAHFFYKNNKLRTIPASAEEQSLKFSIKIMNKTAASDAQLANCIFHYFN